ncbi:hypothetical protein STBA_71880 [Streptomyces sp. MP131-18]|nr:hypothetical protein STBA_71880 [Streptomyces sp. MP131-18]
MSSTSVVSARDTVLRDLRDELHLKGLLPSRVQSRDIDGRPSYSISDMPHSVATELAEALHRDAASWKPLAGMAVWSDHHHRVGEILETPVDSRVWLRCLRTDHRWRTTIRHVRPALLSEIDAARSAPGEQRP